jgi:hypothetical protein
MNNAETDKTFAGSIPKFYEESRPLDLRTYGRGEPPGTRKLTAS